MNYNQYPMYGYGAWPQQNNFQQNQLGNMYQQAQQMPQYPQYPQTVQQTISGKYVDSVDVVKATEVPMGGSGIFPKADMSEIYIKTWNADGTTKILTFRPVVERPDSPNSNSNVQMEDILAQISALNGKMDKLSAELGG